MYLMNKSKRKAQNDMVTTNPDLPRILSLWSILDHKYVQQTAETIPLVLPSIRVNKKIGIPMVDRPAFTRENVVNLTRLDGWEEK
jgi:hypothetical protein